MIYDRYHPTAKSLGASFLIVIPAVVILMCTQHNLEDFRHPTQRDPPIRPCLSIRNSVFLLEKTSIDWAMPPLSILYEDVIGVAVVSHVPVIIH